MSFSFGTPSSAPATSNLSGGFSFGANKPATPAFGLTATSQPSTGLFGTPAASSAPSFGTPAFGATTPAFGAASATPAFGAASATPAFGAASATPAFGATTTPAFGSAPAFGSTPAFGASSAAPAFGTATPAFGSTAPTFGATATPAFGASSTAPTFGATTTPAFGTTGLGTGGLNFGAGTNTGTPATGLSFGTPATTASTGLGGLGGFGFGATTTQNTGFGLLGSTSTATTSTSLFGAKLGTTTVTGTQPSTLATPSLGLGGVAPTSGIGNTSSTDAKSEPPKQTKLPNQIAANVESFKEFVKKQKSLSSEVMRVSIKPLHKVSREAEARLREVSSLGGAVSRARAHSRRVRAAAAAALAAADAAARDLAEPGSELETTAPPQYVKELISDLEQQLITFRRQMEIADKQMQSSPKLLSEQELTLGIRRMHESLVALAGRLQAVHARVQAQKEQYLNLRKYILKDPTNVFDAPYPNASLDQIIRDADTSTKKMKTGISDLSRSSAVLSDPRAVLGGINHLAGPSPFCYVGGGLSPFPGADSSGPSWQPQPAVNASASMSTAEPTFNLHKPPGKRGKQ